MNVLVLTATTDIKVKSGVEIYNYYLKKIFPELKVISYDDVPKSNLEFFSPLKDPIKAFHVNNFVKKNLEKLKPDLIITNGMYGWNLNKTEVNCPIINISHGTFIGLARNAIKMPSLEFFRTRFIYSVFEKASAKNATTVISNSKLTQKLNKKYYGVDSKVIYNPIETQLFKPMDKKTVRKKLGLSIDKKIGLFVGRPEYQKGFDVFEKIAQKKPEISFISITFPKTKSNIKNIKGINVTRQELALYYNAADFVIFPSRFEGFGFVPIEALSSNTEVISSKVGIVNEINLDGLTKVKSLEISAWLKAINKVLATKKRIKTDEFVKKMFEFKIFKEQFLDSVNQNQGL